MNDRREERVAVLLYGFLRTAEVTVGSLLNNLVIPNNADIFYFWPDASDNPGKIHQGILDKSGFIKVNPKNIDSSVAGGVEDRLRNIYGAHLKSFELHNKTLTDFDVHLGSVSKRDWLFDLNPNRFFSMFYNMQGVYRLMKKVEESESFKYDKVFITRPDLSFYSVISKFPVRNGVVNIPAGIGFFTLATVGLGFRTHCSISTRPRVNTYLTPSSTIRFFALAERMLIYLTNWRKIALNTLIKESR